MQLTIQMVLLLTLFVIFFQDFQSRTVYWFLFPLLIIGFLLLNKLQVHVFINFGQTLVNLSVISIMLIAITIYLYFRLGSWINLTTSFLGLGDILFLVTISFYLSVLNFIYFVICSGILAVLGWLLWTGLISKKYKYIPLAGIQAMILAMFLGADWWFFHFRSTDDYWIMRLLMR